MSYLFPHITFLTIWWPSSLPLNPFSYRYHSFFLYIFYTLSFISFSNYFLLLYSSLFFSPNFAMVIMNSPFLSSYCLLVLYFYFYSLISLFILYLFLSNQFVSLHSNPGHFLCFNPFTLSQPFLLSHCCRHVSHPFLTSFSFFYIDYSLCTYQVWPFSDPLFILSSRLFFSFYKLLAFSLPNFLPPVLILLSLLFLLPLMYFLPFYYFTKQTISSHSPKKNTA